MRLLSFKMNGDRLLQQFWKTTLKEKYTFSPPCPAFGVYPRLTPCHLRCQKSLESSHIASKEVTLSPRLQCRNLSCAQNSEIRPFLKSKETEENEWILFLFFAWELRFSFPILRGPPKHKVPWISVKKCFSVKRKIVSWTSASEEKEGIFLLYSGVFFPRFGCHSLVLPFSAVFVTFTRNDLRGGEKQDLVYQYWSGKSELQNKFDHFLLHHSCKTW